MIILLSIPSNFNEFAQTKILYRYFRLKHPLFFDNFGVITKTAMTDDWPEGSHASYKELRALYKKPSGSDKNENSTKNIQMLR